MREDLREQLERWLDSNRWSLALKELFTGFIVWFGFSVLARIAVAILAFLDGHLPGDMAFVKWVMSGVDVAGWFVSAVFFVVFNLRPLLHLIVGWGRSHSGKQG